MKARHYLPRANILYPLAEGSAHGRAELEGVAPDLNHVVDEGAHPGHGECRGKEGDVTKLDQHLQVVVKCILKNNSSAIKLSEVLLLIIIKQ